MRESPIGAGTGATVGRLFSITQATNARLSKVQATKMAQMAQHGLVRTIAPVHTRLDGDLVIGLATHPAEARGDTGNDCWVWGAPRLARKSLNAPAAGMVRMEEDGLGSRIFLA